MKLPSLGVRRQASGDGRGRRAGAWAIAAPGSEEAGLPRCRYVARRLPALVVATRYPVRRRRWPATERTDSAAGYRPLGHLWRVGECSGQTGGWNPCEPVVRRSRRILDAVVTAWGALVDRAKLRQSDTLLVTAASSSLGTTAFQIAKMVGATARAAKKQALLYAGVAHVIVSGEEDIFERVMVLTAGRVRRWCSSPSAGRLLNHSPILRRTTASCWTTAHSVPNRNLPRCSTPGEEPHA